MGRVPTDNWRHAALKLCRDKGPHGTLARAILQSGLHLIDFAKARGIRHNTLYMLLARKRNPHTATRLALADIVPPDKWPPRNGPKGRNALQQLRAVELVGITMDYLTVLAELPSTGLNPYYRVKCRCACGAICIYKRRTVTNWLRHQEKFFAACPTCKEQYTKVLRAERRLAKKRH